MSSETDLRSEFSSHTSKNITDRKSCDIRRDSIDKKSDNVLQNVYSIKNTNIASISPLNRGIF